MVLTSASGDVPHRRTTPAVIGAGRLDPVFKYAIALDRSTDGGEFVIERGLGLVQLSPPRGAPAVDGCLLENHADALASGQDHAART